MNEEAKKPSPLAPVESHWGEKPNDHFGYKSDKERLSKRGMEDWELTENIPDSQRRVPYWFMAVVVAVLLVGVGLSFPFWGQRPGVKVEWLNWGFYGSLIYITVAAIFVYYMVNLYGTKEGGRLDSDPQRDTDDPQHTDKP